MEITLYPKYLLRRLFVHGRHSFFKAGYRLIYPEYSRHGMSPWQHYVIDGRRKGYDNGNHPPAGVFFPEGYLTEYPDVEKSGDDPWHHYAEKGRKEGRDNGLHPKAKIFSAESYTRMYPDVAESGMDAWHHYVLIGKKQGRDNGNHQGGSGGHSVSWPDAAHLYTKNILIIAELSIPQCKLYRVDQKAIALEKDGYKVSVSSWTDKARCVSLMQDCSVVIFYRVPYSDIVIDCYKEAKRLGVRTVFDIDDLVFNEDIYVQVLKEYTLTDAERKNLIDGVKLYRDAMLHADDNWFSTRTLCDLSDEDYGTHSSCIPNCIPEELSVVADEFAGEKKDSGIINIFYGAGSSTHDKDIELVQDALEHILTDNENVELTLIGDIKFDYRNMEIKRKIRKVDRLDLTDYYYLISQSDIAVIPLEQNLFNTAKSNIKYIEASMFSIPSICSDLYEFSSVIKEGENGFIAKSREDWVRDIQFLIDHREKRLAIGRAAHGTVTERYSLDALSRQISSLVEPYSVAKEKKETMLIVNILYGVSSFGGATVVAERLAEELQANSAYDVHVFSTYTDFHDAPGTLRRYSWRGVNVWAVNIPEVNMNYANEDMRETFKRVLDLVSPRLVHFHCIQTMGMDMCLECIEREIPYFVTIHDGWWNCARQFLVDKGGRYCGDKASTCSMCKARCGIKNSDFFRKRHLAQFILGNAEKVYTPSHYFSDLIQRNFPMVQIGTSKNGIIQNDRSAETMNESPVKKDDRIVLGFFGGREQVKGYFFLKDCLESFGSGIDNFRILFIDTSRRNGDEGCIKNDVWPLETEIVGYTPSSRMYTLYRKIDVLLFPSMWKESFGLMVREAIYNDVFVVCSDCGGPSEAVVNNENGLIFPMGDKEKFTECLRLLIQRKEFIKNYKTSNFGDVRTFKEQALELLKDFSAKPSHARHHLLMIQHPELTACMSTESDSSEDKQDNKAETENDGTA